MALIITSTVCGLLAFLAGLALQFQLPFWRTLVGLDRTSAEKYANIDAPRLRRRLSVLMYVLSGGLFGGAILLYVKVMTEALAIPLFLLLVLAVFDGVAIGYRTFDRNDYSASTRRLFRLFLVAVHTAFVLLFMLFIR